MSGCPARQVRPPNARRLNRSEQLCQAGILYPLLALEILRRKSKKWETIVCWYLQWNHQKQGFLRWCKWISSIHSSSMLSRHLTRVAFWSSHDPALTSTVTAENIKAAGVVNMALSFWRVPAFLRGGRKKEENQNENRKPKPVFGVP